MKCGQIVCGLNGDHLVIVGDGSLVILEGPFGIAPPEQRLGTVFRAVLHRPGEVVDSGLVVLQAEPGIAHLVIRHHIGIQGSRFVEVREGTVVVLQSFGLHITLNDVSP